MEKEKIIELQYLLMIRKSLKEIDTKDETEKEIIQILINETDKRIDKLI